LFIVFSLVDSLISKSIHPTKHGRFDSSAWWYILSHGKLQIFYIPISLLLIFKLWRYPSSNLKLITALLRFEQLNCCSDSHVSLWWTLWKAFVFELFKIERQTLSQQRQSKVRVRVLHCGSRHYSRLMSKNYERASAPPNVLITIRTIGHNAWRAAWQIWLTINIDFVSVKIE